MLITSQCRKKIYFILDRRMYQHVYFLKLNYPDTCLWWLIPKHIYILLTLKWWLKLLHVSSCTLYTCVCAYVHTHTHETGSCYVALNEWILPCGWDWLVLTTAQQSSSLCLSWAWTTDVCTYLEVWLNKILSWPSDNNANHPGHFL